MTAGTPAGNVRDHSASRTTPREILLSVLTVLLIAAVLGLAVVGLDVLNELLARGFGSLGSPAI